MLAERRGISTAVAADAIVEERLARGGLDGSRPRIDGVRPVSRRSSADRAGRDRVVPGRSGTREAGRDDHHLEKEFRFADFKEALADYELRVGELAERINHHPDIYLAGNVRLTVWTHKIDGLHEADFVFRGQADRKPLRTRPVDGLPG